MTREHIANDGVSGTRPWREPPAGIGRTELRQKLTVAVMCLSLSVAVVLPFFFMGNPEGRRRWGTDDLSSPVGTGGQDPLRMPSTQDLSQHLGQMKSFYRGLEAGEIYPRWEEDTNRGFGAPATNYYPPGTYYLTSALYFLIRDWTRVLVDLHLLIMIASAAAFYIYVRRFLSRWPAAIGMSAYIMLPYHLIDQYQRGALAELLSFVWMPLILIFVDNLLVSSDKAGGKLSNENGELVKARRPAPATSEALSNMAGLAACYGAFIWSHVPTAYQFTLALTVSLPLLAYLRRAYKGLALAGLAMILGLGLSGAYIYPAAVEQEFIQHDALFGYSSYLTSLIFSHVDGGIVVQREFNHLIDQTWLFNAGAILICGFLLLRFRHHSSLLRQGVIFWLVMAGFAAFMMTPASVSVGKAIPKLEIGVFSWRMLSITTMAIALLLGACIEGSLGATQKGRVDKPFVAGVAAILILVSGVGFSIALVAMPMRAFETFDPTSEHLNNVIIPVDVRLLPQELPMTDTRAGLIGRNGQISIGKWDPEHRQLDVTLNESDRLLIRTFNFPGWTAEVDGQRVGIETFGPLGAIMIQLPARAHSVALDFVDTQPRRLGKAISLASLILLSIMIATRSAASLYTRTGRSGTKGDPRRTMREQAEVAPTSKMIERRRTGLPCSEKTTQTQCLTKLQCV